MVSKVITKRSTTAGVVPLNTDLSVGELAINTADQSLYSKGADGVVFEISRKATNSLSTGLSTTDSAVSSLSTVVSTTGSAIASLSTSTSTAVTSLSTAISGAGGGGAQQRMYVRDEKAVNTPGGAATVGLNDRDLNTVVYNTISGASLSSNVITLPAGKYYVRGKSPAHRTEQSRLFICDSSNNELAYGPCYYYASSGIFASANTECIAYLDFSAATGIKLRLGVYANSGGSLALGIPYYIGTEVYSEVEIIKL